ncbi:hypothetical protein HJC99_01375 [Candidatus Saccharibacteria bacterium]|nr:hypothetical protein [Candidatus Saccharibacteria bacterium]
MSQTTARSVRRIRRTFEITGIVTIAYGIVVGVISSQWFRLRWPKGELDKELLKFTLDDRDGQYTSSRTRPIAAASLARRFPTHSDALDGIADHVQPRI